jgi:hypothetical protein
MGDLVIVTLEEDDLGRMFEQIVSATDALTTWCGERAKAVHGHIPAPTTESPSVERPRCRE